MDSSLFTQQTGHDMSIDLTSIDPTAMASMQTPNPYDLQNSSFLDDLNQDSQMVTERERDPKQNTQMSAGLMISTLNQQSTNLPNILPAIAQGARSDVRLIKNNPYQPPISFSP